MKFKYVMIDSIFPVILHEAVQHKQITGNATSAGFFMIHRGPSGKTEIACYGFSQSLGLKPDEADERILERFFKSIRDEITNN